MIVFVIAGIAVNKHNMKKDKYDLLNYVKTHQDKLSITINENGHETLTIHSDERFPLASTLKILIAFNFIKKATTYEISITDKVEMHELETFYIPNTDGGAHVNWKKSMNYPKEVSLLDVAKGMMQFSSNACTDFLINKIGVEVINASIEDLQLNHDKISYVTPSVLIPGYLSNKRKIAIAKLKTMDKESYQALSQTLFKQMKANETTYLQEKVSHMLNQHMQLLITNKMPSSTTKQYANLMYKLGKQLLTDKEKELFNDIFIGEKFKNTGDDYLWYKGGSTMFVLTSALFKESKDSTISVSVFIKDDSGGELYWIRNIFNDFVISIAQDPEFRKKIKDIVS